MLSDASVECPTAGRERKIVQRGKRVNSTEQLQALGYRLVGYEPICLRVERYNEAAHRNLWEHFIAGSANGNLFQTRRFLEYHPAGRFEDHSLLFWREAELIAVAAGEVTDGAWSSHRFTSHGGIAVRSQLSASEALDVVHALISYAGEQEWHKLFMRYVPYVLAEDFFTTLVWALSIFGFVEDSRELTWCVVPRFSSEAAILSAYRDSARRAIKKVQSESLLVRETSDFPEFWRLLTSNLKARFGVAPTHSLIEIERLRALCPGELRLHGVYDGRGRLVAGSVIFDVSRNASHCFYFAQDYDFQDRRPMALLMHRLNVEYALYRRLKLNYGVITAHGGNELNLGLSRFKSQFGALPAIRRRFTWNKAR
jgi:hypothetical protein